MLDFPQPTNPGSSEPIFWQAESGETMTLLSEILANCEEHEPIWFTPVVAYRLADMPMRPPGEAREFLKELDGWATANGRLNGPKWWVGRRFSQRIRALGK